MSRAIVDIAVVLSKPFPDTPADLPPPSPAAPEFSLGCQPERRPGFAEGVSTPSPGERAHVWGVLRPSVRNDPLGRGPHPLRLSENAGGWCSHRRAWPRVGLIPCVHPASGRPEPCLGPRPGTCCRAFDRGRCIFCSKHARQAQSGIRERPTGPRCEFTRRGPHTAETDSEFSVCVVLCPGDRQWSLSGLFHTVMCNRADGITPHPKGRLWATAPGQRRKDTLINSSSGCGLSPLGRDRNGHKTRPPTLTLRQRVCHQ